MDEKPRRRRFRFGLRAIFAAIALAAIVLGWITYNLRWKASRDRFKAAHRNAHVQYYLYYPQPSAPGSLAWFVTAASVAGALKS